jgi:hypothetical protein
VQTLEALKAAGKVRHIGLSGNASECTRIGAVRPALAEVLQLELPRDAEGLPCGISGKSPAVSFWEFTSDPRDARLTREIERLRAAAPQGILMVSTKSAAQLRATVENIENTSSGLTRSVTSTLA